PSARWALLAGLCLLGSAQAQSRYTVASSGTEVTDTKTGLTWQRCSAGQSWNGSTCTGSAATYTHEQALAYAKTQTGWRLPSVKELSSLADKGRSNPAIDTTAFPATASDWYWTSSPVVGSPVSAWDVSFNYGGVNGASRDLTYHVRLVR
ncbi:MAG: hypothetical protein RLZZ494_466, partial [Pseudomonadota bacterium]